MSRPIPPDCWQELYVEASVEIAALIAAFAEDAEGGVMALLESELQMWERSQNPYHMALCARIRDLATEVP